MNVDVMTNSCVPFHKVITIYNNDVYVMSPLCTCVALETTVLIEQKYLITEIARVNTSLNMHNLHKIQLGNVYMLSSVRRVRLYVANLEVNWHCDNDLFNSVPHAHAMDDYSLEQFSFNLVT